MRSHALANDNDDNVYYSDSPERQLEGCQERSAAALVSSFAYLADKVPDQPKTAMREVVAPSTTPPSRIGRKSISGYFLPESSLALHHCARKNDLCLQELMAAALNDVLRK